METIKSKTMKKRVTVLPILFAFCFVCLNLNAQNEKFKVIQGLGYLHTQVSIIVNGWEIHPLNIVPMDDFEEEFEKHFLEELEHDEEWVESLMVEDGIMNALEGIIDDEAEEAIFANLAFYESVIKGLRDPEKVNVSSWRAQLLEANSRLYEVIFPDLINE